MSPERLTAVLDQVADQLGSSRMWRVTIGSGIGLVLCGALVVILCGVYFSGSATLDDIGLPAVMGTVLTLICLGGLVYGVVGIRDIAKDPLVLALKASPPAIAKIERLSDAWGVSVRFHLASGAAYRIYMPGSMADEIGHWLGAR